jgi:hypothetical protein
MARGEADTRVLLKYVPGLAEIEDPARRDQKDPIFIKRLKVQELNELCRGCHTADTIDKVQELIEPIMKQELERYEMDLPKGTYIIKDGHGLLEHGEDVARTLEIARAGERDCILELEEKHEFRRIKQLEAKNRRFETLFEEVFERMKGATDETDAKIKKAKDDVQRGVDKIDAKIRNEIDRNIEELTANCGQLQSQVVSILEKLNDINPQEIRDMTDMCRILQENVKTSLMRLETFEKNFLRDKQRMEEDIKRNHDELVHLTKYLTGKIDVCIESDGDLRRDLQLTSERMGLLADDLRLHSEALHELTLKSNGALEESEELRTLLGTMREDNEHLRGECGQVRTRIHAIEGAATDNWQGFAPGVLYFRRFHNTAKGNDVYLSKDHSSATAHGFFAITGQVINNFEGLVVADGPCRRFGTPGSFSSYFEIEVDDVQKAPEGAGGLYVGFSLQNGEEIFGHPRKEFDGWLIGGAGKALITRASPYERADGEEIKPLSSIQPAAFGSDITENSAKKAQEALQMLRVAMKPGPKGTWGEYSAQWGSGNLRISDRVGVLFKCHRNGGARMRVLVNGEVKCSHEFSVDVAPPADAIGFLTPVLRLAGTGKGAKLIPGVSPPGRALVENP